METIIWGLGLNVAMISKPPPFTGLNIRIPIIIPIKGRGLINQASSGLGTAET